MRLKLALAALILPLTLPATAALAPGAKAPDFKAQGAIAGRDFTVQLSQQLKKGPVVLYFFPAAFTAGCSAEAAAFAAAIDDFKAAGATVIGMSADPVDKLREFSAKDCAGKFAVASASPAVIRGYDVALGRQIQGRDATNRTSYVIAPDGKIVYVHSDLSPADHVRNTLAAVQRWRAARKR
ncbi:peroxiredoxin [Sphingomonas sp. BE123]|uniref:peroxiredoxin n=1 Tax=unclassified Sphingomonas TaxID=196159 RepID=UPI0028588573|nr:redoxin domain-containing protein [Sphingomonas sp. BE123]MDR6852321.1 peroxiredoxin [Sphingomonas sp. BE123]